MDIELNEDQVYALYDMEKWWYDSNNQIFELSGAGGTGKTFLVKYFIDRINLDMSHVKFIAYMGKAAMALARTGLPAQTIHSLIYDFNKDVKIDPETGKKSYNYYFTLKDKVELKGIKLLVLDEGSMVNEQIAKDLLSFNIPMLILGDLNQLPPVIGNSVFLKNPNYILTKIMRQAENDPIIYLSQRVLNDEPLHYGVYGNSSVIKKSELQDFHLKEADIVLTATNNLRDKINSLYRENIMDIKRLDIPNVGEKVICRKNYWNRSINENIFLINGMTGTFTYIDISSLTKNRGVKCDFHPDFLKDKKFKNLNVSIDRLFDKPTDNKFKYLGMYEFEFAYAITTHLSQGSQYDNVVYLDEDGVFDKDTMRRLRYTAISRAAKKIIIVK